MHRLVCILSLLVWQAAMSPKQITGANTPSYEEMLEAVRSGTFDVDGGDHLPAPKTELEELLARSKLLCIQIFDVKTDKAQHQDPHCQQIGLTLSTASFAGQKYKNINCE